MALVPIEPQLALKITPPRIPKTALDRPRLSSARPEFSDKAVIAIQAAPGSGKTLLLAQWRKEALQSGAAVAWLTLDGRDTDDRFVLGLAAAMRAGCGRPDFGRACMRAANLDENSLEGITEWLAEVADLAAETLLLLDEVHALPESTLGSSVAYLLINAPANLKIVLASRKPIALPIAELPVRGSVAVLTGRDLQFDLAETVATLQARFGRKIELDSCARLHEITEGWPLGLQLAMSTIERSPDLRAAIAAFTLKSGDIARYFMQCLVDQMPEQTAQFLARVAFVESLSDELCEAITRDEHARELLAQLRESTPIFSEGVDGVWSRIHPLAREFLLTRFERLPEEQRTECRCRAAHWLELHGQFEEAARHMFDAGHVDEAYSLVERSLHDVLVRGEVSRVAEWCGRLPHKEILERTNLRLTVGWVLAQSERQAEAARLVGPLVDDPTVDAGVRCESAEICATAALFADDIDGMGRIFASWQGSLPADSMTRRVVGLNQLAFLTLYRGAPEQSRYTFQQLPADAGAAGRYALGWRDWIIGCSYLWEGQVDLAARNLRVALARAEDESGRRSPIAVTLASALAAAEWERGDAGAAAELLANRLDVLERRAPPDAIMMGYVTAARLAVLDNDEQRALDLLDQLLSLSESRGLPRLYVASLGERIRIHAVRGRADVCAVVERKLETALADLRARDLGLLQPLVDIQAGLARAYSSVARRDWQAVLDQLSDLVPVVQRMRRGRDAVQVFLLRALATIRLGKDGAPMLEEATSMMRMWGLARVVEDTHPDLVRLVGQSRPEGDHVDARRDEIQAAAHRGDTAAKVQPARRTRAARGAILSPREAEVLRLLGSGLSNKQIALAMGVTEETIKWHFKNLFRKLNAASRSHLLHRARMVGILDAVT
jgi:LuxR family transcriptional regulator, maltose regulon positive regulatory protein